MDFYCLHNIDGEYGCIVLNILVEVEDILLETGSWLNGDEWVFFWET